MRKYSLDSFGSTFAILTVKFIDSGKQTFDIECQSQGEATNIRMRMHQFWKIALGMEKSALPPDMQRVHAQIGELTTLPDKSKPMVATIAWKSERKIDRAMLGALKDIDKPDVLPADVVGLAVAAVDASRPAIDPIEAVLQKEGLVPK